MEEKDKKPALENEEGDKSRNRNAGFAGAYFKLLFTTLSAIVVIAAVGILVAFFWTPILTMHSNSMSPTLDEGNVVLAVNKSKFEVGDVIAFYYGSKMLVKRCVAGPGSVVNIDESGYVTVDGKLIDETYVSGRALGQCDITFPYTVPDERYFVLGDNRSVSVDSRSTAVGCVASEQIIGKVKLRIWPPFKWFT